MAQSLGSVLFLAAVIGNLVVIVTGLVVTVALSLYRGMLRAGEMQASAARHDAAFHHPDPVATPLLEQVFMLGATALVLVGLPVVLAATFSYLVPMIGKAWTH